MLVLPSAITGCVSISAFASSVCVLVGITNSVVGLNICAIIVGIKEYKSIVQKKKKKHHQIVLLGKDNLNTKKPLISKALVDSYISHEGFVLANNVL